MMRVILADDHALFRQSLSALLHSQEGIAVVGEAGDGHEALRLIEATGPDVAILDISMPGPGGLEIARTVREQGWPTKVLLLTMLTGPDLVQQAMEAGAQGFLLKENTFDELMDALKALAEGATYVSRFMVSRLSSQGCSGEKSKSHLTPREQEVLQAIASGLSNKKIAKTLHISIKTVETHRTHIMQRLNIHTTADLVRYAAAHGLI